MSLLCNGPEFLELDSEDNFDGGASDRLILSLAHDDHPTNRVTMEAEKRIRREIANSNERRRMQSINAGFQSLRTLLPRHEGEKLSKAAILQQTAEYIYSLEQEKTRLLSQNCQLKRLLNRREGGDAPPKKRKSEAPSADEADESAPELLALPTATALSGGGGAERLADETRELRLALERERRLRALLEERVREPPLFEADALALYGERLASPPPPPSREILERIVPVECPPDAEALAPAPAPASRSPSPAGRAPPPPPPPPPLLEAAIKAEPKVEVEVLPDARCASPSRLYLPSTSRQNLETIVEAIRHLEGDHLFGEERDRDAPLALTADARAKPESEAAAAAAARQRLLRVEVEPFLRFEASRRQSRPGVIVVKQS